MSDLGHIRYKRISVSICFFVNGFLYANWASRLPELQRFFQVTNARLGSLLFSLAAGAMIAMPLAGWLTTRLGSKRVTQLGGFLFCILISLMPFSNDLIVVAFLFVAIGIANGMMDVAMNGQAVYVERLWGKTIMSSFHAVFSIGMAIGAAAGAFFAHIHLPLSIHLSLMAFAGLTALVLASFYLVEDPPSLAKKDHAGIHFKLPGRAILPLGLIAFCSMTGEGSMADWSAIYMNRIIGKDESFSALAFGGFGMAMTVGRIFGDYFTLKLGKRNLLIYDSILALSGLAMALLFDSPWTTLSGFILVGLGLATVVPIIFSTAGNWPGIAPGVGIAMASSIGYAGLFIGPPAIGYLSDSFNLRIGLCFSLLLFAIMLALVLNSKFKSGPEAAKQF